jgi:hypothetical protein
MVQIQSRQERSMWVSALINTVPDVALSWVASEIFNSGLVGLVAVFLGLQCLYIILWLKTALWSWLLFWISGRRKMAAGFEQDLYQNRFPRPPEFLSGADDYFMQISNNGTLECPIRVKAAVELGVMTGIKTSGRFSYGLQVHLAFEDALEKYALRFPLSLDS